MLTGNKIFRVTFLFAYLHLPSICAHTEEKKVETVESTGQAADTQLSMRYHERRVFIGRLYPRLFLSLHLKCFNRRRAQELTDGNCAARMKHAKILLQKFPQYATDFVFFMDKKVFSVTSPDNQQNKVSGRLRELLKKKLSIFFSAGTARSATAWPPVNCACVPQLFEQLINTMFCPAFLRKFVCQPLRCVPFRIQSFYQNLVLIT